jgi:hypothetical protein
MCAVVTVIFGVHNSASVIITVIKSVAKNSRVEACRIPPP